jgi:hypothetical protein
MRGIWRWYVALLTALSFCLVVATSASHLHQTTAAAHDCAICCVVVDKLADAPPPLALVHAVMLRSYRIIVDGTRFEVAYASSQLLPPSRGPPRASV